MTCQNKQFTPIQIRRGLEADFISSNIVLASGEPAYAVNTKHLKIGDGVTSWSNLSGIYLNNQLTQFSPISSATLASLITDETGTGLAVFNSSPTLTGIPLAPTASSGTNTNQVATTSFVRTEITNLIDSAPSLLDTLNELAAAINDDASFAVTISNNITTVSGIANNKVDKSGDTMTGALNAPSGLFSQYLSVNSVPVSVSGHTHASNNITDFTEAVQDVVGASGFLIGQSGITINYNDGSNTLTITGGGGGGATISNAGDNRILTSDGTSTGINGESNATFDGTNFNVTGVFNLDNLRLDANTLSSTNSNGNIIINPTGTGKVGIGSVTPSVDLEIYRSVNADTAIRVNNPNTGSSAHSNLQFGTNAGSNVGGIAMYGSNFTRPNEMYIYSDTTGGINLAVQPSGPIKFGTNNTERMRITNTGIGIGTTSPSYLLDVNGGGQFNQLYPTVVSASIVSSAVDTDVSSGQIFDVTLTENITLNNPTNSVDGVTIRWRISQDATGGYSVTLDSKFNIPSSASNPLPWSTAANATDILAATYHAGRDKWDIVAFVPGY